MPVPFDLCWFGCYEDTINITLRSKCWLPSPQYSLADNRTWWVVFKAAHPQLPTPSPKVGH
jgi:hypothetical protein